MIKSIFCVLRGGLKIWCDEEGVFLCWMGEGEALFFVWRRELVRVIGRRDKCVCVCGKKTGKKDKTLRKYSYRIVQQVITLNVNFLLYLVLRNQVTVKQHELKPPLHFTVI